MKLLIAISIAFVIFVSSQDQTDEVATKMAYDLITKLLNMFANKDLDGLDAIYDDLFVFTMCESKFNKSVMIDTVRNSTNEFKFEYNVTDGVLNGDELRFHVASIVLGRPREDGDTDFVDYIARKNEDGDWILWKSNFTRCDLFKNGTFIG